MKKIIAVLGMTMLIGLLSACGAKNEDGSFGLKDFEGLYYQNGTEQMEDYEISYTYGYLFNGDGTGMYYGQDLVEITWNETEIHCGDKVYNYDMEPGKLTVHEDGMDNTYEKASGKFIKPNPYTVDVSNIEDGTYSASVNADDISEEDGRYTVAAGIFTEDTYDIVDIASMTSGDVIYINGELIVVDTVETSDTGFKNINGGIEEGGSSLRSVEESNCFVFAGFNDYVSYTRQGVARLELTDDIKLVDGTDPVETKEYVGAEAVEQLKSLAGSFLISENNCSICIENGVAVEITCTYLP